jgi:TRAP-type C4-dicarboxylate transport system permease small subunit
MNLDKITWPMAFLVVGLAAVAALVLVGVPTLAIARGWVPPAVLFGPLGTVLLSVASAVAAYTKGKHELPPYLEDEAIRKVVANSGRPPPPDAR